ncbi:MAG: S1 RNA-binding domain-containing protein, partial [Christensenellales bacterium]
SICYTTKGRQEKAEEVAEHCDCVLVVGDKSSSNCRKLYDMASAFCNEVYFIENVSDLKSVQIKNNLVKLGILSGASTPEELTMEVFNRMSEQSVINNVVDEVKEEKVEAVAEPTEKQAEKEITTMAEAMKKINTKSYHEGMRLKTHVVKADITGITVAVDGCGKNDCGFIAKEEAELDGSYDPANYAIGAEIEAIIIPKEPGSKEKAINLSKKAFDAIKLDDEKVKGILAGDEFTLACTQEIKGGLLGKIGTYSIFVPASQIRMGFVKSLADYVGKPLRLKALPPKEEVDAEGNVVKPRNPKRIVASQRVILEAEKAEKEEEFWSKIYEGAIVNGKVKRFASFGAFVSLKFMDALVHNSDLSWSKKRINDPSEVLELNKSYDFIVLKADRETGKISLGYKQLQKHPSEIAQEKYPVGSVVKGKVARIVSFGAFVELEPGIDGLVHISQINHGWIQNAADALKEGDEVEVKVMKYDNDRITLSIKELIEPPVVEEPAAEEEATERPSRTASFNRRLEAQEKGERKEKKAKRVKEEADNEPREYVSGTSGVTLGDLFKNIKLDENND